MADQALAVDVVKTQGSNTVSVATDVRAAVADLMNGESLDVLAPLADRLVRQMETIEGLEVVKSGLEVAQPALGVRIKRDAASGLGISLQLAGATLQPMLGGEDVTDWTSPDGRNFTLRLPAEMRNDLDTLRTLPIAQSGVTGSRMVRLDQMADMIEVFGPPEILRQNLSRHTCPPRRWAR